MNICRCGHPSTVHGPTWGDVGCIDCGCPEYRAAETRESQTLRGTEAL